MPKLNHYMHYLDSTTLAAEKEFGLPPRKALQQQLGHATGWASHYGGIDCLSQYCRLMPGFRPDFSATWQHGVTEPWRYSRFPYQLLYGIKHPAEHLILVATQEQQLALANIGYSNVHPVGCPWIYAEPINKPKRLSNSILVMPPHTLDGAPFEDQSQISEYCRYIVRRYSHLTDILVVSLHGSCIRNHQWLPPLRECGIKVISGADHSDASSYLRVWHMLSLFETVCTPNIGSHVYYALAAGCKVCIEGPPISYSINQMVKDETYLLSLDNGEDILSSEFIEVAEERFKRSFSVPRSDVALGMRMTGMNHKKTPSAMRKLLGWTKRQQLGRLTLKEVPRIRNMASRAIGKLTG
jgi:hypothetical protein